MSSQAGDGGGATINSLSYRRTKAVRRCIIVVALVAAIVEWLQAKIHTYMYSEGLPLAAPDYVLG